MALAGLNLPTWGSLRLALPTNGNSDASYSRVSAVAAASAPPGAPATQGIAAMRTWLAPTQTGGQLAGGGDEHAAEANRCGNRAGARA